MIVLVMLIILKVLSKVGTLVEIIKEKKQYSKCDRKVGVCVCMWAVALATVLALYESCISCVFYVYNVCTM